MAPLKKKKGPPEMTYGSQIYHGSPKVLRGTQGVLAVCDGIFLYYSIDSDI